MRLANHRLGENGKTLPDYVTVQVDPFLDFVHQRVKIGRLLRCPTPPSFQALIQQPWIPQVERKATLLPDGET